MLLLTSRIFCSISTNAIIKIWFQYWVKTLIQKINNNNTTTQKRNTLVKIFRIRVEHVVNHEGKKHRRLIVKTSGILEVVRLCRGSMQALTPYFLTIYIYSCAHERLPLKECDRLMKKGFLLKAAFRVRTCDYSIQRQHAKAPLKKTRVALGDCRGKAIA